MRMFWKKRTLKALKEEPIEVTPAIMDDWFSRKTHWWDTYYWWLRHGIWQWIGDRPRKTKYFFQRGWRGWADEDIWGFHCYLSKVILEGLKELKRYKHGYPATVDPNTGKYEYDEKRWDVILDEMVEGFELVRKCSCGGEYGKEDLEIGYSYSEKKKEKMNKYMQEKFPNWRLTTKAEENKIKRAFALLGKHFWSLWD